MILSQDRGDPKAIILIIGTPKMVPPILGNHQNVILSNLGGARYPDFLAGGQLCWQYGIQTRV